MRPVVSDRHWASIEPLIAEYDPAALSQGRELLNALLYRALTGCTWETLILDDPWWSTVREVQERWQQSGLLDRISEIILIRLDD